MCAGRFLGLLLAEGQDSVLVEGDHVPVIGAMGDLDQPDGAVDLVGGLLEGPAAILGPVGDLHHRRAVQPVMAVEEDRRVGRIGEDGRRFIEEIGDCVFRREVFRPALVDDRDVDPADTQLVRSPVPGPTGSDRQDEPGPGWS